ncbi:MAG: glycoside hydrolase family 27 protein [Saprospiraceae bacterium]|nr:glycoside hydrolase family 27 protein [Pyrinomonadaceae bacterium]
MKQFLFLLIIILSVSIVQAQKFDNLALTPPMGWNSWNKFGCDVTEKLVRETADAIVLSGMKDAGYQYVVIDDCWHGTRDAQGFIQPSVEHFPSGMKALGDYIHSKGLKFGIYSDVGAKTCAGRPGSRGYEYQDALVYASWGVDYLKYDWCNSEGINPVGAYTTMRDALYAAKRPVLFSICEWGDNKPWEWAKPVGHMWRTTGDITHCWDCEENHGTWSSFGIMRILDKQKGLRIHAKPGSWNDPDMMEVGNGMTLAEDRAHFSLWAMLSAPLIAGNDVRKMSRETREILTNKGIIAINQDSLGIQAFPAISENGLEVWAKPLANGSWAICFLNRSGESKTLNFDWKENFIKDDFAGRQFNAKKDSYKVRDLWLKKDLGTTDVSLKAVIPSHDVIVLRLEMQGK